MWNSGFVSIKRSIIIDSQVLATRVLGSGFSGRPLWAFMSTMYLRDGSGTLWCSLLPTLSLLCACQDPLSQVTYVGQMAT